MAEEEAKLAKIAITYRREPDGAVVLILSDGMASATLYPSPLGRTDLLLNLIAALLRLIPYQGDLEYDWWGDETIYHWRFHLAGNRIRVEANDWDGAPIFAATCDVWQFAAKLRLCASRLATTEDARRAHGGDWVRADIGYQQLCARLDARKSAR